MVGMLLCLVCVPSADWRLVWRDEFNGKGRPDPKKWTYETGYVRNQEAQYYTSDRRENARLEGGRLVIEARKDDFQGHPITAASLTTQGIADWTYGRVEVRAKVPTGRGTWPAIWTLGSDISKIGWPKCGEIDIMEYVGMDPEKIHWNVHTNKPGTGEHVGAGTSRSYPNVWEGFHVYGVEWSKDRLDFSFDGEKTYSYVRSEHPDMEWNFDKPHYLILNLAIGGGWGGQKGIDDKIFPARFEVDYVRVYKKR
jgi:beta-glucanase (GH16 family)